MSIPQSHEDLLQLEVASLATIGPDGCPQVTALWFLYEDGKIKISLNETRQKTKNLLVRPECTFFVIDPKNQFHTLEVRANAELIPDPDYTFAARVSAKYGADMRNMDKPGQMRYEVVLHPTKVNANG